MALLDRRFEHGVCACISVRDHDAAKPLESPTRSDKKVELR